MGTIKSSESMELAEYLRSQRTTTEEEVFADAEGHSPLARYGARQDRVSPAAH